MSRVLESPDLVFIGIDGEGAGVAVGIAGQLDAFLPGVLDQLPSGDRITKDAQQALEPLMVGFLGGKLLLKLR